MLAVDFFISHVLVLSGGDHSQSRRSAVEIFTCILLRSDVLPMFGLVDHLNSQLVTQKVL